MDSHPDIGFRIKIPNLPSGLQWALTGFVYTKWKAYWRSAGGDRGVFTSARAAKMSLAQHGFHGKYEIWKFHMGTLDSDIPYFDPEKVYEKV